MIKLEELNPKKFKTTPEIDANLEELCRRLNFVRAAYGKPMKITSGLRDMEDHKRIYRQKGITDGAKIPMRSRHLFGQAADVFDPKQELQTWCLLNVNKLEEFGLWCESFEVTPNWCHFQIVPPASGKRFFKP